MKKGIVHFLLCCSCSMILAQAPEKNFFFETRSSANTSHSEIRSAEQYDHHQSDRSDQLSHKRSSAEVIPFGYYLTVYSMLLDGQNQVSYHPDINSVIFIHRSHYYIQGISFDVSTDGGATWQLKNEISPDCAAGEAPALANKYPGATIYNPPGNTDPDQAFIVANGPALDPDAPGNWGYTFRISATLDGEHLDEQYYQTPDEPFDYHPLGIDYCSSGAMWDVSTTFNNTGNADLNDLNFDKYRINKITPNEAGTGFDYSTTTMEPDFYTYVPVGAANEENYAGLGWGVHFDPTGTIGYLVILGGLDDGPTTISPVIYKSDDAGESWNLLPVSDFSTLTTFEENTPPAWDGTRVPFFTNYDAVVDSNGVLQMITEFTGRTTTSTDPDSLYSIWQNYSGFTHLSVSDGSDWNANLLGYSNLLRDSLNCGYPELFAIPYRVQASRNSAGTRVFFTYTMTDSSYHTYHQAPDLMVTGYNVMTNEYTWTKNYSSGTDAEGEVYFPVVSPVTMDDGYGNYEIPVVFFQPTTDVFYLKGVTLTDEDFSPDAVADFGYYQLSSSVSFINNSAYALSYSWDFGDGSPVSTLEDPVHDYPSTGNYTVCLTASNQTSSDTSCELINIIGVENLLNDIWSISPVPAHDNLLIGCNCNLQIDHVQLTDLSGKTTTVPCQPAGDGFIADLTEIPSGQYLVSIWSEGQLWVKTLIVL